MKKKISWQTPGSDIVHTIPVGAEVFFESARGAKVKVTLGKADMRITVEEGVSTFSVIESGQISTMSVKGRHNISIRRGEE